MKSHLLASVLSLIAILGVSACFKPCLGATPQQDRQRLLNHDKESQNRKRSRVALIIGNSAYENANRLANPGNDAEDMASALRGLGFELIGGKAHVNQTSDHMKQLILAFGEKLANRGGVGLFYYAGHGVQSQGRNYMIPVEANIIREKTLEFDAVDVNRVLSEMDAAGNGFNVVILDACRNNPFTISLRGSNQGLAQVNAPEGTLIAYATSPGKVASDGISRNGTYTAALLKHMRTPGLAIEQVFKAVRAAVKASTDGRQIPWEASSLVGDFSFDGSLTSAGSTPKESTFNSETAREQALWDVVKDSRDPQDFRDYLAKHPNGVHRDAAAMKLRRLDAAKPERKDNESPKDAVAPSGPMRSISIGRTGKVPGLAGVLNPKLDSHGRTYIYGNNIAIAGGKAQPVSFEINKPFHVEDSKGNRFELTVSAIDKNGATIRYRKLDNSSDLLNVTTEIRVIDQRGSALEGAQVLILFDDNTYAEASTDERGKIRIESLKRPSATVFCAHPRFEAFNREMDLRDPLTIQLRADQNKGSVIFADGQGSVPGLDGRLNPKLDTRNRTYIYAANIKIEDDQSQPYRFTQGVPFLVRDRSGNRFSLEVVSILGRSSLIEFRRM